MKVICRVNNYQYGMPQFKAIRERFSYGEVLVNSKLHLVYLAFEECDLNVSWLRRLINGRLEVIE